MAKINLAVFNLKGGVGKTTLAIILTQIALQKGEKVVAIDQDEQANFYSSMFYLKSEKKYKDLLTLKTVFDEKDLNIPADWLIIDCPPTLNDRSKIAIKNTDIILIPVKPDIYSIMNIPKIIKAAGDFKSVYQFPVVKVGFAEGSKLAANSIAQKISDKNYVVAGDLPINNHITANISASRYKWWCIGMQAASRKPFEKLYTNIKKLDDIIKKKS